MAILCQELLEERQKMVKSRAGCDGISVSLSCSSLEKQLTQVQTTSNDPIKSQPLILPSFPPLYVSIRTHL